MTERWSGGETPPGQRFSFFRDMKSGVKSTQRSGVKRSGGPE